MEDTKRLKNYGPISTTNTGVVFAQHPLRVGALKLMKFPLCTLVDRSLFHGCLAPWKSPKPWRSGLWPQLQTDLITCWQQSGINYERSQPISFGNSRKIDSPTTTVQTRRLDGRSGTDGRAASQSVGRRAISGISRLQAGRRVQPQSLGRIMILKACSTIAPGIVLVYSTCDLVRTRASSQRELYK